MSAWQWRWRWFLHRYVHRQRWIMWDPDRRVLRRMTFADFATQERRYSAFLTTLAGKAWAERIEGR